MSCGQALALLWISIMNQSQTCKSVIKNIPLLFERLHFDGKFKIFTYEEIYYAMTIPTILHRFPKKMSTYLTESLITIYNRFDGKPDDLFAERQKIISNLLHFKGIGEHKAKISLYVYDCFCNNAIIQYEQLQCKINQEDILEEILYLRSLDEKQGD